MSATDRRALLFSIALVGCELVLDLDAEGADGGNDGGAAMGGGTWAGGTGGEACDGHLRFAGQQLVSIADDSHLDLENEFAITARLRFEAASVSPGGGVYEGTILSRVDLPGQKGYALVVVERHDDGIVYPELRAFAGNELCVCAGTVPVPADRWVSVGAAFADRGGKASDAAVFVEGDVACQLSCGDDKLSKFHGAAAIGSASNGASGFFRGAISEVAVRRWRPGDTLTTGCGAEPYLYVSFDAGVEQAFSADCPDAIELTLGASSAPGPDDPEVVTCP